jgi:hypothetical protein
MKASITFCGIIILGMILEHFVEGALQLIILEGILYFTLYDFWEGRK